MGAFARSSRAPPGGLLDATTSGLLDTTGTFTDGITGTNGLPGIFKSGF
jgi:hypothetical protein